MDLEYSQFMQVVGEKNQAFQKSLECAIIVFEKAQELPPAMRRYMIDNLKEILSENEGVNSYRLD